MILPKQGTYERKLLDYLFTIQPRGSRSLKQIKENFGGAISQASLDRVIESELMDGRIVSFSGGFALSVEARKEFYKQQAADAPVVAAPALKPMSAHLHMKTKGTRTDSDSRVYLSKHV